MAESVKHRIFIGNDSNALDRADPIELNDLDLLDVPFTADSTFISADSDIRSADEDLNGDPLDPNEVVPERLDANNNFAEIFQGGTGVINVLFNDIFKGQDKANITLAIEQQGIHGSASVSPEKMITYVHDGQTLDVDSFSYRLDDGVSSDVAQVNIRIKRVLATDPAVNGTSFNISNEGAYVGRSSFQGSNQSGEQACSFVLGGVKYHNGINENPILGDTVYNDKDNNTPFNGANKYFNISTGRTVQINRYGVVVDVWICGAGNA